jgi:hypothetical protein
MVSMEQREGQRGMGTVGILAVVVAVGVAGFFLVVAGGAYVDVSGFQGDLEKNIPEMQYSCFNADCEPLFLEEIEELRVLKGRDLEIDWDNMDWLGADNKLLVRGWKIVDFKLYKYYYYFTLEIPVHQ